jgi:hypothetical protein
MILSLVALATPGMRQALAAARPVTGSGGG